LQLSKAKERRAESSNLPIQRTTVTSGQEAAFNKGSGTIQHQQYEPARSEWLKAEKLSFPVPDQGNEKTKCLK
jgi:hypothetical protein